MRRDVCWLCGGKLIWQCDYDLEDYGFMDVEGMIATLMCSDCGADVVYTLQNELEEE